MSRIKNKFNELKEKGRKALITFVTAGDPDLATTVRLVREMEANGADIIELGIPYSDPIAEGPVIQRANVRALKNNIKLADIFNNVMEIRKETEIPLVFLLYFNIIFKYGPEKFFSKCSEAGLDGVIVPDLPFEEIDEIKETAENFGIDIISLVSPTSKERIMDIAERAKGFLYCVSSLGVTGTRSDFDTDFDDFFSSMSNHVKIPTALGFGISTPEHVSKLKKYSDGLIVGSAIVKRIEESTSSDEAVKNVGKFVKELRDAMDD